MTPRFCWTLLPGSTKTGQKIPAIFRYERSCFRHRHNVFLFREEPKVTIRVKEYLATHGKLNLSIISYYEIIAGLTFKDAAKQRADFLRFSTSNNLLHISEESARISGKIYAQLRSKGISIGTSDILIAGIAIENDLTLITNNEKHYRPISGLRVENWMR